MHSARLDTLYFEESFSRMSDMFNRAMYNRYISRLLEYSSAFFVIVNLFWNSIFVHDELILFLEIKVINA
jgi:hypothetical protein